MNLINIFREHRKIQKIDRKIRSCVHTTHPIVFIYQMGKVGSTAIATALKKRNDCFAFQFHRLRSEYCGSFWNPDRRSWLSYSLKKNIIEKGLPVKIITLVRDPFARNISAFFENPETETFLKNHVGNTLFMEDLINRFVEASNHQANELWFTNEFQSVLGIDIFSWPFNKLRGWDIYSQAPFEILVLKVTLPDEEKACRISEFLGIPDVRIERDNQTSDKSIKDIYKAFKESAQLPENIAKAVLDSRFTHHFFTDDEIRGFYKRWLPPTIGKDI